MYQIYYLTLVQLKSYISFKMYKLLVESRSIHPAHTPTLCTIEADNDGTIYTAQDMFDALGMNFRVQPLIKTHKVSRNRIRIGIDLLSVAPDEDGYNYIPWSPISSPSVADFMLRRTSQHNRWLSHYCYTSLHMVYLKK